VRAFVRGLIAAWRLTRATLHLLHGVAIIATGMSRRDVSQRRALVQWWSTKLLRLLGVELRLVGAFGPGAQLIVANHVSWLDITAIHAVCPQARFVSKSDVKSWPLISRLVDAGDTLYVERERKRDAMRVVHQMAAALAGGDVVAVFPEGTTGEGHAPLPFHANLLQAAIASGAKIQPVALRFSEPGQPISSAAIYVGDTSLAQSMARIAAAKGLAVTLAVLAPMACEALDRRQLATQLHARISAALPSSAGQGPLA
jgi:1-acyl-sn-glycerol-3-phosphate acyltransferase